MDPKYKMRNSDAQLLFYCICYVPVSAFQALRVGFGLLLNNKIGSFIYAKRTEFASNKIRSAVTVENQSVLKSLMSNGFFVLPPTPLHDRRVLSSMKSSVSCLFKTVKVALAGLVKVL